MTATTLAEKALRFVRAVSLDREPGAWVLNTEICKHLGVKPNAIVPSLTPAVEKGLIERSKNHCKCIQWRLPMKKPRRTPKVVPSPAPPTPKFGLGDWPPGFVSQFDSVKVAAYEERRK